MDQHSRVITGLLRLALREPPLQRTTPLRLFLRRQAETNLARETGDDPVLRTQSGDRRDLGASIGQLEWTVSAYTLTFAGLLMTAAAIGDMVRSAPGCSQQGWASSLPGRRRVLSRPGSGALIASGAVQGLSAAMVNAAGAGVAERRRPAAAPRHG